MGTCTARHADRKAAVWLEAPSHSFRNSLDSLLLRKRAGPGRAGPCNKHALCWFEIQIESNRQTWVKQYAGKPPRLPCFIRTIAASFFLGAAVSNETPNIVLVPGKTHLSRKILDGIPLLRQSIKGKRSVSHRVGFHPWLRGGGGYATYTDVWQYWPSINRLIHMAQIHVSVAKKGIPYNCGEMKRGNCLQFPTSVRHGQHGR